MINPIPSSAVLQPRRRIAWPFVIPVYNEANIVAAVIARVHAETTRLKLHLEIVIVDKGSIDGMFQNAIALAQGAPVRALCLSRNFGKEQAIAAALERAEAAAVIILGADMQKPTVYLENMLEHYRGGFEMVYATRADCRDEPRVNRAFIGLGFIIAEEAVSYAVSDQ